jgi:hypothetical protein
VERSWIEVSEDLECYNAVLLTIERLVYLSEGPKT